MCLCFASDTKSFYPSQVYQSQVTVPDSSSVFQVVWCYGWKVNGCYKTPDVTITYLHRKQLTEHGKIRNST